MNPLRRLIYVVFGTLGCMVAWLSAPAVLAKDEPYVVIRTNSDVPPGRTVYSLNVGYLPQAFSGQGWDPEGRPYVMNSVTREWSLQATARKDWNERWTFVVGGRHYRLSVAEERIYTAQREKIRTVESTWGMQLGLQNKLQPGHPLQPKVGLTVALPEQTIEAQFGWSMVRDPMVLSGFLGYGRDVKTAKSRLMAGFGLGFVANDVLSVGVSVQHLMLNETWAPPTNRVALSVGYVVDHAKGRQVNIETAFWSDGERFIASFGMGWTVHRL